MNRSVAVVDLLREVSDSISRRVASEEVPSIAVAVAREGEVLLATESGWANRARGLRATTNTAYSIGSITKPMTATALMVLVERGLVDLDRPINQYLGETGVCAHVGVAEDATVRRVASHTAGLPPHYNFFYADESRQRPHMDLSILRYGHIVSPPGERFEYSNFGYGLLEYVIERVSGVGFQEFLATEVFDSLGMTRSALGLPASLIESAAERYDADGLPFPAIDSDHRGGSSAYASALDLLRFGMFHLDSRRSVRPLLSRESTLSMQTPRVVTGAGRGYGLGWRTLDCRDGHSCVYHDGRMDGVTARLTLVPTGDIAVAVLSNSINTQCYRISDDVLAALLPGFQSEESVRRGTNRPKTDIRPRIRPRSNSWKRVRGCWKGFIHAHDGDTPVELEIGNRRVWRFRIDGRQPSILQNVELTANRLKGMTHGHLGPEDPDENPCPLHLDLTLRSGRFNGYVTAVSERGTRLGSALSYWCDLESASG